MRNAGKGPLWVDFLLQKANAIIVFTKNRLTPTLTQTSLLKLLICVLFGRKLYTTVLKYGFV